MGFDFGFGVGLADRLADGLRVGHTVGFDFGFGVGLADCLADGLLVRHTVGFDFGLGVGLADRLADRLLVGHTVGFDFSRRCAQDQLIKEITLVVAQCAAQCAQFLGQTFQRLGFLLAHGAVLLGQFVRVMRWR